MRRVTLRAVAIALTLVAAALIVVATPRIPAVWSVVWDVGDTVTGGVDERHERLVDHPFPATLAPPGYPLEGFEESVDPAGYRHGVNVWFAGPDYENSISYYPAAMIAPEVLDYWTHRDDVFGLDPVAVEGLGEHALCHEGDDVFDETHVVSCIAAFDGMAIIANSANTKPARGNPRHAVTLLRAGVEHWESIRD